MTLETLLASAFGGLCVIGIGLLLKNSYRQAEKTDKLVDAVNEQKVTLTAMSSTLAVVVNRVDALDRWKDAKQAQELSDARAALTEYKREHPPE